MPALCYMCDSVATSEEHAPPKCLFPVSKDSLNGIDLRVNLIKVPSCEQHNTTRSKDDEYLMYVLPQSLGSNDEGKALHRTKVTRAIARRPKLANSMSTGAKEVIIHDTENNQWFKTYAIPIDVRRINSVLEMNARAIYYHHYGKKFDGKVSVFRNFLVSLEDPGLNALSEHLFNIAKALFLSEPLIGSNPDIFTFRFARHLTTELLELNFFSKNKVLVQMEHS